MTEQFEIPVIREANWRQLSRDLAELGHAFQHVKLDSARACSVEVGSRRWTFVMSQEAVANWEKLGQATFVLGVLLYYYPVLERSTPQRILVALPGDKNQVKLEMRDGSSKVLWTGSGRVKNGELEFEMPITRERVDVQGVMAGRMSAKGRITLIDARLPKPIKKNEPTFVSED